MELVGKVGIVTGAAQGMGRATAEAMAREGASVVVSDINEEGAKKVASAINKSGGKAISVKVDISKEDEVNRMVEKTIAEFGRVDILVNVAALAGPNVYYKSFVDSQPREWRHELDITFVGTLLCCKAVIGHMLKQEYGRIISISSDAGKTGFAHLPIYSALKAGVSGFSRALALDVATKGITVNCVSPGTIKTPGQIEAMAKLSFGDDVLKSNIPMGRAGEPEDIANMIVFLASDKGRFITGQDYSVNGGFRM